MKKSEAKEYIKELIVAELSVEEGTYVGAGAVAALQKDPKFAASKDKVTPINTLKAGGSVTLENEEDFDKEPSLSDLDSDIDDNSSMSALKSRYDGIVKLMQSIANKWKNADEPEKSKHLAKLKKLTNIKNELTSMMNPSLDDEDEI
jgi:hypothetical protein